jgi:hypothetical protein
MTSAFSKLIDTLSDNTYTVKNRDIPEELDNRDEVIAEIQETLDDGGYLPDDLTYFVLNEQTDAGGLLALLDSYLRQFKVEFHEGRHFDNASLSGELLQQITIIEKGIQQGIKESQQLKNDSLTQMFETKLRFCNEVTKFLNQNHDAESIPARYGKQEKRSYKWLKDQETLTKFYNELKSHDLIAKETDIDDFKAVFSNIPIDDINTPIQWEKGSKLFAYYFKQLLEKGFIPKKPSWALLSDLFTYSRTDKGEYVPISSNVRTFVTEINSTGAPKDAGIIDSIITSLSDSNQQ